MMHQTSPELPSLEPGITLLETDERMTGSLQSLVLDQLLLDDGSAIWIDAHGNGTTHPLTRITPSEQSRICNPGVTLDIRTNVTHFFLSYVSVSGG